jgi:hypothetical protein
VADKPIKGISERVEVKAVLNKPESGREEVILVPTTTHTDDFTVNFSLDANDLALSSTTTIEATVYATIETDAGPVFESFAQSLTIPLKEHLLEFNKDLGSSQKASFGELSYEQIGDFDYSVRLKPDSPFGAIIINPPSPIPHKPESDRKEIILVPTATHTDDFTVNFSLHTNELASSSTTTIIATVYTTIETDAGPVFESFAQSLTIPLKGHFLELNKDLGSSQKASFGELSYEQIGGFDYSVHLKPDSPFGAITINPPSPTPPELPSPPESPALPSSKTIGPGETLFLNLFESMDITFSYHFESDWPLNQVAEEVEINAVLGNPGVWSKTFALVPPITKNGDFSVTFPLEPDQLNQFRDVYQTITNETGASTSRSLIIKAKVHTIAQTGYGPIDEEFSQSLSTTLDSDTLVWSGELAGSRAGTIETTGMIPNPDTFVWLSITQARNLFATLLGIVFILFLYSLMMNVWFKPEKLPNIEEEALRARKKHKGVIVDVDDVPEADAQEKVIRASSLDELIKAADNMLMPVFHKAEAQRHIYYVIYGSTRYEYISEA